MHFQAIPTLTSWLASATLFQKEKIMNHKSTFSFLAILAVLLAACSTPQATAQPQQSAQSPIQKLVNPAPVVDSVKINEDEGVINAIERSCGCVMKNFVNLGVFVEDNWGNVYFEDLNALLWSGVTYLPPVQAGNIVIYGERDEVSKYVNSSLSRLENTIRLASTTSWDGSTDTLTNELKVSGGGIYDQTMTYVQVDIHSSVGNWFIQACEYLDPTLFAQAIGETGRSNAAWAKLCMK